MPSVLDYSDYRRFLGDFLASAKKSRSDLSHRAIQQRMGISSSGYVANVLSGKKNLTPAAAAKLARILKLSKTESRYFECLVLFNQARSLDDRNEYLARMRACSSKLMSASQLTLFSKWYYVAVRALLSYNARPASNAALAAQLSPPITPEQAGEAVRVLSDLGFVRRAAGGGYELADAAVTSGDEVKSVDLARFQVETLEMAKNSLQRTPSEQRDISTLTLSVSRDTFQEIKAEIQLFRKHLSAIACADPAPDRVCQVNIQLFPLTRTKD
jgi:uncharacterized protein (TIGR02147 family)